MKVIKEINSLDELDLGRGAQETLKVIEHLGKTDKLYNLIDMVFENDIPSEDDIDNFLWFEIDEREEYLEIMGISKEDYEAACGEVA